MRCRCSCRNVQIGPILYWKHQCWWHRVVEWLAWLFEGRTD